MYPTSITLHTHGPDHPFILYEVQHLLIGQVFNMSLHLSGLGKVEVVLLKGRRKALTTLTWDSDRHQCSADQISFALQSHKVDLTWSMRCCDLKTLLVHLHIWTLYLWFRMAGSDLLCGGLAWVLRSRAVCGLSVLIELSFLAEMGLSLCSTATIVHALHA